MLFHCCNAIHSRFIIKKVYMINSKVPTHSHCSTNCFSYEASSICFINKFGRQSSRFSWKTPSCNPLNPLATSATMSMPQPTDERCFIEYKFVLIFHLPTYILNTMTGSLLYSRTKLFTFWLKSVWMRLCGKFINNSWWQDEVENIF